MIEMKKILFPTDFSDSSDHAVRYAVSFAQEFDAKLYVLHIVEDVSNAAYFDMLAGPPLQEMYAEMEARAWESVKRAVPETKRSDVDWEPLVRRGAPAIEICHTAEELEVDLVVLGTHGRTGLKHMLFGSVAEKVVRMAPCPVLSVRHPDHVMDLPEKGGADA